MHISINLVLFLSISEIITMFLRLNNKRKHFHINSGIFLGSFYKRNECIFEIKICTLVIYII